MSGAVNVVKSGVGEITGASAQKRAARAAERGARRAEGIQQRGLEQQQAQFQQQQRQIAPFTQQSLQAREQLAQLAAAPLGEGAAFQGAQRAGLQNLKRALASQGSFFSGRFGEGAASLNLGLLGQQQNQRLAALQQLGAPNTLGIAAGLTGQQAQAGAQGTANLAGLALQRGAIGAQAAASPGFLQQAVGLGTGLASSGLFGSGAKKFGQGLAGTGLFQ